MPFPRWTFWKIIPIAHLGSWKNAEREGWLIVNIEE